ncbi:MAG: MotE family protein [Syntrophothermus sp.]
MKFKFKFPAQKGVIGKIVGFFKAIWRVLRRGRVLALLLLTAGIGTAVVLDFLGFVDIGRMAMDGLSRVPYVSSVVETYQMGLKEKKVFLARETKLTEQYQSTELSRQALMAEEKGLQAKKDELAAKEAELKQREKALQQQAEEVKQLVDDAARLQLMARYYGKMQPEEAAKIMAELTATEIAQILERLTDRQAAAILPYLEPPKAAEVLRAIGKQY